MRVALSLGMVLGMGHGWIVTEFPELAQTPWPEVIETVKTDTDFSAFGSGFSDSFPY